MSNEELSRERLLRCAAEEFMTYGFEKASLRRICSSAGLTTGAVYFMFGDKNGLFGALVDPTLTRLTEALQSHFSEDQEEDFTSYIHHPGDHDEFAVKLVSVLYSDYDALLLLLTRSEGSRYAGITDQIIALVESHMHELACRYVATMPGKRVNEYMHHWLCHLSVMAFVHLITHVRDEAEALRRVPAMFEHIIAGWIMFIAEDDSAPVG